MPSCLPPTEAKIIALPLVAAQDARAFGGIKDGEIFLARLYSSIMRRAAMKIGHIIRQVATGSGLPGVFHCTAGKDRTGVGEVIGFAYWRQNMYIVPCGSQDACEALLVGGKGANRGR